MAAGERCIGFFPATAREKLRDFITTFMTQPESTAPLQTRRSGSWSSRVAACLTWCVCTLALASFAQAQPVSPQREAAVKAAFLYKFSSFVQWPAEALPAPDKPFAIGVYGNDEVAAELEALVNGRTVGPRPVVARRVREVGPGMDLQILYIGRQDEPRLRSLVSRVIDPVLLVTEQEGALAMGSVINLFTDGDRVRFSVSLTSAEARSLKLSARLLAVAQQVEGITR